MPTIIRKNDIDWIKFSSEDFFVLNQKIGTFFVCKMTPKLLKEISKNDINRYESMEEIQRDLRGSRVKEIHEYIYGKQYATFPNSFIISVSNESQYIPEENSLYIPFKQNEAYILDGQHRLSGFSDNEEVFEILVSVFIGLDKFHQAMIFANINGEQMKVNKSLIYSLYGFSDIRTHELITYTIISNLNTEDTSPWKNKIKILGKGDGNLSLAPFYESLFSALKGGVFKSYYQEDKAKFHGFINSDNKLYYVLEDYFNTIKELFPVEWGNNDYIVTKTTGFYAFFRILVYIFEVKQYNQYPYFPQPSLESFKKFLKNINKDSLQLTSSNYPSGIAGQNKLFNELKEKLNLG